MNLPVRSGTDYSPLLVDPAAVSPTWATAAQAEVNALLVGCAAAFATTCRASPNPSFPRDVIRHAALRYGRGLGADESAAFLRALEHGLVTVDSDGHFFVPGARICSPNLHLVGRNEDHVAVHTEVLVHVGAYAELVLEGGWDPGRLAFDPFILGAALDLWGFREPPGGEQEWWEGSITFVAEAKARTSGSDSLTGLAEAFDRLQHDPDANVHRGHRRKWDELVRIVNTHGTVELLLAADGARWWYDASPSIEGRSWVQLSRRALR